MHDMVVLNELKLMYINYTLSFSVASQNINLSLLITLLINNIQDDELIKANFIQQLGITDIKKFGKSYFLIIIILIHKV